LLVGANIYKHTMLGKRPEWMDIEEKAWNLPQFDAVLSLNYAVNERFTVETDIYVIGKREGLMVQLDNSQSSNITWDQIGLLFSSSSLPYTGVEKNYVMDTAFDLNLSGKYEISRKLSVFAQLNNFGFRKYEKWLGYPVQSFNVLGGISYSF
jgi:hypothetical protein